MDISQAHPLSSVDSPRDELNDEGVGDGSLVQQSRRPPALSSLQISACSVETAVTMVEIPLAATPTPTPCASWAGLPPRTNSARLPASVRNLLPQKSYQTRDAGQDIERTVLIMLEPPPSDGPALRPSFFRSFSLNKIFSSSSSKVGHSLTVAQAAEGTSASAMDREAENSNIPKAEVKKHIIRSLSVPTSVKSRSLKITAPPSGLVRVVPAAPKSEEIGSGIQNDASANATGEICPVNDNAGEDIPEEDAVCRICMVELGEGGDTLKMECSCKGELALAHQECALKWFSIKGNKICDVCHQEVQNLQVKLLKISNPRTVTRQRAAGQQQSIVVRYRVWEDVSVLVMVSILAYFCFLEQLLVSDLGPRAFALTLPFSCILGLISSLIASSMVSRNYIWAYACFQFVSVILFSSVFYNMLNANAVLSIIMSSFTGFGIAISINSLLIGYVKWRQRRQTRPLNPTPTQETRVQQGAENLQEEATQV